MVETEPRYGARQIGAGIPDTLAFGRVPAQISLLHDVLGLQERAEHAVGKAGEPPPMRLERLTGLVLAVHHAALFEDRKRLAGDRQARARLPVAERVF